MSQRRRTFVNVMQFDWENVSRCHFEDCLSSICERNDDDEVTPTDVINAIIQTASTTHYCGLQYAFNKDNYDMMVAVAKLVFNDIREGGHLFAFPCQGMVELEVGHRIAVWSDEHLREHPNHQEELNLGYNA